MAYAIIKICIIAYIQNIILQRFTTVFLNNTI